MAIDERIQEAVTAGKLSETAAYNLSRWMTEARFVEYRDTLESWITENRWSDLNEAFYQLIPFGTGGRRGPVGLGTNRMNRMTIAESVQGVANKLRKTVIGRRPKVVVAYDTRTTSAEFTLESACVLAGNDIEVYLFDGPRSTPELSFMINDLSCDAGVVISASHNPPEDNGFKAYWTDGGQVVPPMDAELIEEVKNVSEIRKISFEQAYGEGLIHRLGAADDARYIDALLKQSLSDKRDVRIVFSPLHGTGLTSVLPLMKQAGFTDVHLVESQKDPDGRFPNVPNHKPNPEVTTGLDASIALAKAIDADIVMVTDPDADRLGCAVKGRTPGEYTLLTGNQCAALMMEFIGSKMQAAGTLRPELRVYSTCVSSPLMPTIARTYGCDVKDDLLVGFKWVAEQIKLQGDPNDFLFGSEESIGFMKGSQTRDKDGAMGALMFSELAAEAKADGLTVLDVLDNIYKKYGYFCDTGIAVFLEGASGAERMGRIMEALRQTPPSEIAGHAVVQVVDRADNTIKNAQGKVIDKVSGPTSNLLIFRLREDAKSWIAIRPSGTEPKIKFYFSLYAEVGADLATLKDSQTGELKRLASAVRELALAID